MADGPEWLVPGALPDFAAARLQAGDLDMAAPGGLGWPAVTRQPADENGAGLPGVAKPAFLGNAWVWMPSWLFHRNIQTYNR
jgi:hypothetical protein